MSNREGRHVLVIVTDGGDTTSKYRYRDAHREAHLADAVVYPIVVVPISNDAGRNVGGENALPQMAKDTGGRTFYPSVGAQLDQAFADILRDLRTQYLLGYYPRDLPRMRPTSIRFAWRWGAPICGLRRARDIMGSRALEPLTIIRGWKSQPSQSSRSNLGGSQLPQAPDREPRPACECA